MDSKVFNIKWKDLTEKARKEYLGFFEVSQPVVTNSGDLVLDNDNFPTEIKN